MRNDVSQALLYKVLKDTIPAIDDDEFEIIKKNFQAMARYKYDDYQQVEGSEDTSSTLKEKSEVSNS